MIDEISGSHNEVTQIYVEGDLHVHYYSSETESYVSGRVEDAIVGQAITQAQTSVFDKARLRGWGGSGYQYVLFGNYRQSFIDEPILWRVLGTNDRYALLLSELIIETLPYDYSSNEWVGSNNYNWLNGTFYTSAFSDSERSAIALDASLGHVFLMSRSEMANPAFGFNSDLSAYDENRKAFSSLTAVENKLWVSESGWSSYFLRTTPNWKNVDQIRSDGSIGVARVERDNVGIRPAVWVEIDKLPFVTGDGTFSMPFQ